MEDNLDSLKLTLRVQLTTPESVVIEAVQRVLFTEHGMDVRRVDIAQAIWRVALDQFNPTGVDGLSSHSVENVYADSVVDIEYDDVSDSQTSTHPILGVRDDGVVRSAQDDVSDKSVTNNAVSGTVGLWLELHCLLDRPATLVAGRKPTGIRMPDGNNVDVSNWTSLTRAILGWCAQAAPLPSIPIRPGGPASTYYFVNYEPRHQVTPMARPFEFLWKGQKLFAEMNQTGKNLLASAAQVLLVTGHKTSDVFIAIDGGGSEANVAPGGGKNLGLVIAGTLRLLGAPAHYIRIAEAYNRDSAKPVTPERLRARLINYTDLFAHLGKGVYALKEWGVNGLESLPKEGGTIASILLQLLEKADTPMGFTELCSGVLSIRTCKETSVRWHLANDKQFCSFGHGKYGLKRWVT